ncbi:DUF6799 domain-containing protein [Hymenobacter terrenus]|uniref:DUF6799 domain-containing protein n=1 Tax=Hymenobacter terrenus TaxID=1629124 RepID=UPI000695EEB8|nr:DUF6799 domain-containing protein [Hymenobacter terrenus]
MKNTLLGFSLFCLLSAGCPPSALAQSNPSESSGYLPWFTVQNHTVMVQNGTKTKPLGKDVTLPSGIRVEYRTQAVVLANGTRVTMQEGDMLSLNGEFIRHKGEDASQPVASTSTIITAPEVITPAPAPTVAPAVTMAVAPTVAPAAAKAPAPRATFSYQPTAPVNGKLRGVVELGASGFNMFIIRIDEKRNWKLEKSEFGNSLVIENMATEADIRNGLKAYIGKMLDFGVGGRDIHFVVSSGAVAAEGTKKIVKGLESFKYVVTTVTPELEGALGLRAALPASFSDNSFLVDMGSGNTKVAWMDKGQTHVVSTFGSKYFEQNTDPRSVATDVKAKAEQVPAKLRGTCFIIGGVPYELAKAVRQGQEPYTVLSAADAYPQLTGAKVKAGLTIYQAIAAATGCQQFVFGYDTNFTIGYLLSLP